MAPTWLPKRSPNRSKIEAKSNHFLNASFGISFLYERKIEIKINQFLHASWDRNFEGFGWILEAKRSQVGTQMASKIDANFERRIIQKLMFSLGKTNF